MKSNSKKKFDYFAAFKDMSNCAVEAATLLENVFNNYNLAENFQEHIEDMKHIEHASDEIMYEIMNHIVKDFITPIEREDIIYLAQALDDVTDNIDDVFTYMYMYHITVLRPEAIEMAEVVTRSAEALRRAAKEFSHFKKSKKIKERIIEVSDLEKVSDRLFMQAIYNLYDEPSLDAKTIMVWQDIFQRLEDCCDAIEHVSTSMETVLLQNS